ncbi:hypothetical protein PC110_g21419 [Phytophthora cactorum]|uniref:Uncharacterized protein n=1 Tax=Phytophthora cactorum TaxID=29920 RepID=A0A329RDM1_9STRA|nr:hypothetical protein PC110_g21419 [Phytophthora cactorum]
MRAYPEFYVGLLKPYQDPAQVSVEALAPGRQVAAGRKREVEREGPGAARPPPALLDERGKRHHHVERLVTRVCRTTLFDSKVYRS